MMWVSPNHLLDDPGESESTVKYRIFFIGSHHFVSECTCIIGVNTHIILSIEAACSVCTFTIVFDIWQAAEDEDKKKTDEHRAVRHTMVCHIRLTYSLNKYECTLEHKP